MGVTKMAASKTSLIEVHPNGSESLTGLVGRLGEDVVHLLDSQLALFKVEIREEANFFARSAALTAVGAIIVSIGFALLNVAIAFAVSTLFTQTNLSEPARYALGFIVTGVFYLLVGGVVMLAIKNRLAKQKLVPQRTVEELRKDKAWLKNEL
jgi:uncharacterized membrane protein YqjE